MYKQNDILVGCGGERKVLGACGEVYLISYCDNFTEYAGGYTKQELDKAGYTLKASPWEPKDGEKYWVIVSNGDVSPSTWRNGPADIKCKSMGNCFQTREAAEEARDKVKELLLGLKK